MSNKRLKSEGEMSFIEHLEELRWHIIRSLIAIGIITVAAFIAYPFIFDVLIFGPKESDFITYDTFCWLSQNLRLGEALCMNPKDFEIINTDMAGQFITHIKVSLVLGFIAAFPYVFWEFWRFVEPGLLEEERKYSKSIVFISSLLFLIGVLFSYFVLTPFSINFFASYTLSETIQNTITLGSFIGIITTLALATGIMFELPLVVYFLSKLGLLTPAIMRTYRKHAFTVILLIAAIITPADVASQILVSVPVYFLYEISIIVSARVTRKMQQKEKDEIEAIGNSVPDNDVPATRD